MPRDPLDDPSRWVVRELRAAGVPLDKAIGVGLLMRETFGGRRYYVRKPPERPRSRAAEAGDARLSPRGDVAPEDALGLLP